MKLDTRLKSAYLPLLLVILVGCFGLTLAAQENCNANVVCGQCHMMEYNIQPEGDRFKHTAKCVSCRSGSRVIPGNSVSGLSTKSFQDFNLGLNVGTGCETDPSSQSNTDGTEDPLGRGQKEFEDSKKKYFLYFGIAGGVVCVVVIICGITCYLKANRKRDKMLKHAGDYGRQIRQNAGIGQPAMAPMAPPMVPMQAQNRPFAMAPASQPNALPPGFA